VLGGVQVAQLAADGGLDVDVNAARCGGIWGSAGYLAAFAESRVGLRVSCAYGAGVVRHGWVVLRGCQVLRQG